MNIIITGASRGIGKALSINLSNAGHKVIAISRNTSELQKLEEQYENIYAFPFDLVGGDYAVLSKQIKWKFGKVDGVVNNAGAILNKSFSEITPLELQNVYEVNVFGPFQLLQSIKPLLIESELKHVVNISSMGGFQGSAKFPGLSAYSSSKAAIASLSECLAEEWKEEGIKVNALAIGAVQTEMLSEAFPGYQAPLSPEQMAEFMSNFLLTQCKYFNGKVLPVSVSTP